MIAGHQLAKAGFRLASLLNEIWTQPVRPNDATGATNSAPRSASSIETAIGQIVGNRRSKIYAWPGCGTYDKMAPENRVLFPSSRGCGTGRVSGGAELPLVNSV